MPSAGSAVKLCVAAASSGAAWTASWKGIILATSPTQCLLGPMPRAAILGWLPTGLYKPASRQLQIPPSKSCHAPTAYSTATASASTTLWSITASTLPFTARQGAVVTPQQDLRVTVRPAWSCSVLIKLLLLHKYNARGGLDDASYGVVALSW